MGIHNSARENLRFQQMCHKLFSMRVLSFWKLMCLINGDTFFVLLQMELLDYVAAKFHEEMGVFKLLIVDSIMALFRVDYSGRGELAERQQKLAQMMSRLQKIAEEYNVAVFISNQMTADPGAGMTFQVDPKKPIGGHILAHASTTRIMLKKGRGETRIAKADDGRRPDPEHDGDHLRGDARDFLLSKAVLLALVLTEEKRVVGVKQEALDQFSTSAERLAMPFPQE
ncbi:unnamed protein product [Heligmosomoides polygyrus]|uniref:RECA_2 domain-containing protein n=1 Tax=Heligmosomoides polygyrus TaxID=6339 RepID=A0A183GPQ4_HELPZ|nr:unnamed protein product [Heligmosomoides polygyrus]